MVIKIGKLEIKNRYAMAPMGPLGLGDCEGGWDFPVALRFSLKSMVKDFREGALPGEEFEEKAPYKEFSLYS